VVEGRSCQRYGEGHHRVGQYADHLRRSPRASGRCGGGGRRWCGHRAQAAGGQRGGIRDVYGMREPLAKAGLRYFDDEEALRREQK
jgi:hypothetical protein